MKFFNLKAGKLSLPIYDIGTLAAGFYIGYNEGKGIDVSPSVEYLTKYGPTTFAMVTTPMMIKVISTLDKMSKILNKNLQNGNFEVTQKDGSKKTYGDFKKERPDINSKIVNKTKNLESKLENPKYLKPTLIFGAKTAIETTIGYVVGKLYSQIT